ncbi:hypothetical protein MPER_05436, partial [Moniliophthora perniciosa FA553]
ALRYLSIIVAASLIPTLPFCKGRVPELRVRIRAPEPRGSVSDRWWRRGTFGIVMAVNTMQGFGYFVPIVWLPTFASALHISATKASVTLARLNGGWSSLWTSFIKLLSEDPTLATTMFGYMGLTRGLGNIFSTPISTALSSSSYSNNATTVAAGSYNGDTIADGR